MPEAAPGLRASSAASRLSRRTRSQSTSSSAPGAPADAAFGMRSKPGPAGSVPAASQDVHARRLCDGVLCEVQYGAAQLIRSRARARPAGHMHRPQARTHAPPPARERGSGRGGALV